MSSGCLQEHNQRDRILTDFETIITSFVTTRTILFVVSEVEQLKEPFFIVRKSILLIDHSAAFIFAAKIGAAGCYSPEMRQISQPMQLY